MNSKVEIVMVSLTGQIVKAITIDRLKKNKQTLSMEARPKGVYLVKIVIGDILKINKKVILK